MTGAHVFAFFLGSFCTVFFLALRSNAYNHEDFEDEEDTLEYER